MSGFDEQGQGQQAAEEGWYRDNLNPARERYWDGTAWTAHTRPSQEVADPLNPAPPGTVVHSGIDALPRPEGDGAAGWYVDDLVPNRMRYWDGKEWTTITRLAQTPPKPTAKSRIQGWAIALLGITALAGGLAIGFFVAYDKSEPGFHADARASAISNAQEKYGTTVTQTETQTVIRTTPAPKP